jgi:hypothetical protein
MGGEGAALVRARPPLPPPPPPPRRRRPRTDWVGWTATTPRKPPHASRPTCCGKRDPCSAKEPLAQYAPHRHRHRHRHQFTPCGVSCVCRVCRVRVCRVCVVCRVCGAQVFEALDVRTGELVAVKELVLPSSPSGQEVPLPPLPGLSSVLCLLVFLFARLR